jgi:pyridoxine 5-phosphate synthase
VPLLSVNIDHIATLRQARYRAGKPNTPGWGEPDVALLFREAERGGAHGITVHLREDRRHITDHDVRALRSLVRVRFNLEMAATDEMIRIAARVRPDTVMLVPEGRLEVTTEGGLDIAARPARLGNVVRRLHDSGDFAVSAFIDAEEEQIQAAAACGFDICELHTGPYAHAFARHSGDFSRASLAREHAALVRCVRAVRDAGMVCNAGHALSHANVRPVAAIPGLHELHIGHAIVARAVWVGLRRSTREMIRAMRGRSGPAGARS